MEAESSFLVTTIATILRRWTIGGQEFREIDHRIGTQMGKVIVVARFCERELRISVPPAMEKGNREAAESAGVPRSPELPDRTLELNRLLRIG